jgi:hypothetical protein
MFREALKHDGAHFLAESIKAAERVERTAAPKEVVRVGGERVAVRTEFQLAFVAMLVEIACHDAVLQHARDHEAIAARGPGEIAGQREICREQHRGPEREGARAAP